MDVENIEGGHQQLQPGQLFLVLLLVRDPKLLQRVNKKSNQNSCSYGTTKEDPHDDVDLVDVNIKVPVEKIHLLFWRRFWFWVALTVLTSTDQHILVREVGVDSLRQDCRSN